MKRQITLFLFFQCGFLCPFAVASSTHHPKKFTVLQDNSLVSFKAIGRPSALRINGKGEAPVCNFVVDGKKASGTCTVKLESLDTGINLRNRHMKEKYLEVQTFPQASFFLDALELPQALGQNQEAFRFKGKLNLHGVEKEITGHFTLQAMSPNPQLIADFVILLSDFNIQIPSFMGITVANEVQVQVQIDLVPQEAP